MADWCRSRSLAVAGAVLLSSLAAANPSAGQVSPRYTVSRSLIFAIRMSNPALLVVSSTTGLAGVDPATGVELWTRGDLVNTSPDRMSELLATRTNGSGGPAPLTVTQLTMERIAETRLGVVTTFHGRDPGRVEVIDLASGDGQWDSRRITSDDVWGTVSIDDSLLLMFGVPRDSRRPTVTGVDASTGAVRWSRNDVFSRLPPNVRYLDEPVGLRTSVAAGPAPLKDSDTTAILFLTDDELVKVNLGTGEKVWVLELRGAHPSRRTTGIAGMLISNGILFVPFGVSLAAVDPETGRLLWRTSSRLPGMITQLEITAPGMLVRGTAGWDASRNQSYGRPFIDLLDIFTGASHWPDDSRRVRYNTNFLLTGSHAYAGVGDVLFDLSLANGHATQVAGLKFQGFESLQRLELIDHDVLGFSSQNLARLDTLGSIRFSTYVRPPAPPLFRQARPPAPRLFHGSAYVPQTWHADFVVMLANSLPGGGGRGLVKVAKSSGEIVAELPLRDRTPTYLFDEELGLILVLDSDDVLRSYQF